MIFYVATIPVLVSITIFQSVIISKIHLLHGSINLIMLVALAWAIQENTPRVTSLAVIAGMLFSLISAVPFYVPIISLLFLIILTRIVRNKLWRMPIIVMVLMTIFGTLFEHLFTIFTIQLSGTSIPFDQSLSLIILPSALMNMIISIPVYAIVTDIARWAYPVEMET